MPACLHSLLVLSAMIGSPPPPAASDLVVEVWAIKPGVDPSQLLVHEGKLFASGFHAGRVSATDLLTGKKLGETALDGYEAVIDEVVDSEKVPVKKVHHYCGGSIARAAGKLFVEQVFSDSLLVIDPDSMRVLKRLPLGDGLLAAAPDGKTVVCARKKMDEFHFIDPNTYEYTTVPYPDGGHGVSAVVVSPGGRFVVLGIQRGGQPNGTKTTIDKGNSFLAVYDRVEKKYAAALYMASSTTQSVSEFVNALVYAPDGKTLYAGMFQAETGVRVIDPSKWTILDDIRFEPNARNEFFPYTDPLGLAFHQGKLYVANRENQEVVVVDPGTRKPIARLRFADGKHAFHRIHTEKDRVYLADQGAVYELDGWAFARRLNAHAEKGDKSPPEFILRVRSD